MPRTTYNKRDCQALLDTKALRSQYAITSMGGIDRLLYWEKKATNIEVTSEPILSWDDLYARISAMENTPVEIATPGLVTMDPKDKTDEEIMEFAKGA